MARRQLIVILGLALVAGLTVWRATKEGANNANFPNGTEWRCLNPECGKVFRMSIKELGNHHATRWGEPTAMARSRPDWMCGSAATRSAYIIGTWPPMVSVIAGTPPL